MKITESERGFIIDNSSVEFALIGPKGKHRGVLVRSSDVGLDLIGFAELSSKESRREWGKFSVLNWFSLGSRYYHTKSHYFSNIDEDQYDNRSSDYDLIWRGFASSGDVKRISDEISRRAADLHGAIKNREIDEIEWQIAPLIALCQRATTRLRRLRWLNVFAVGCVVAIYIWFVYDYLLIL